MKTRMTSRTLIFFVVLTGISALYTVVVVGFAAPTICFSNMYSPSCRSTTTILRYIAETNYNDAQYHQYHPRDVKVVDVEVEGKSKFVYIPLYEMEDAVNKAQENHERDCANMQSVINEQKEQLERLKQQNKKTDLSERMHYDHLSSDAEVKWGENHEEKMKRTTARVQYLTNENQRLQRELDGERERFELEKGRLQQKLEEARDETAEAEQILSLERSYFETAIKLLEAGLERETKNVKELEEHLLQYNQMGYDVDHGHPFQDDLPPFETWEASGAYQQQQEHHHHGFHHHPYHQHEEVFEDFQPQVRPQEISHYPQESHIHPQHDVIFQEQEAQNFHLQHSDQTMQQFSYPRSDVNANIRRPTKATTTVMGASSIRDNLGINDIRDPLYR